MKFMKKAMALAACVTCMLALGACGGNGNAQQTEGQSEGAAVEQRAEQASEAAGQQAEKQSEASVALEGQAPESTGTDNTGADTSAEPVDIKVGSLKGPTTMGIVNLMKKAENGETADNYEFTMATAADEISAKLVSGDLDIALVPANLASVLYNKTNGGIRVVDINTLGVLYCVTTDGSVTSIADLAGKTVVTTGQGTTPEYALRTVLEWNGITDCTLEFKSEASEVAALLAQDAAQIAVLPQPFVTAAMMQNDKLSLAFSLSDVWDQADKGSRLVTGVTVVRTAFFDSQEDAVMRFVAEHAESVQKAESDPQGTADLVAEYGIIEKAPVALKALPYCNIVCITEDEMQAALSGYLQTLYEQNPQSVGGNLPAEDFYLMQK